MTMLIRELTEQIECITEATEDGKRNYFVEGIIMQSAIKNRNGRVYPKETMMNELNRYNTEYVNKNRALGELGHPCFDENAMALTNQGWKFIKDVTENDLVYSLNTETNSLEIVPVEKVNINPFEGKMIRIKGKDFETIVTPYHRFWIIDRYGNGSFITAEEIKNKLENKDSTLSHSYIPRKAKGYYLDYRYTEIEEIDYNDNVYCLTTRNSTFIAKHYNGSFVTGNCSVTINLDRVSHMFTELHQDGSNVVGRAKILETPMGNIVKGLIDGGAQLGISSRGMGSIKQNSQGIMEVQSDFRLTTAGDIVSDPSAPDAFIKGIMEGVEWVYDIASSSWVMQNTFDKIEETVKKSNKIDESTALKLFTNFIENL